ncbi:MAG TPA: DUF58 domain-containing protein [Polyangiales bacterium]
MAKPDLSRRAEHGFDEAFLKRLELLSLVTRHVTRSHSRAERRSVHTGAGIEFADYRNYSPGDDYRHIDWHAYARVGRLLLRLYEQPSDLFVYLLVDRSGSMGFGAPPKLDYAKRLAAALAYVGLAQLDRVGLRAFSGVEQTQWRPTRGRRHIHGIFEFLAKLEPSGPTDLAAAMRRFVATERRPGLAILISDLYDPAGFESAVDVLRYARFEPHILQIVDPDERSPQLQGDLELCDVETGSTRAVTVTPALLARYRAVRAATEARMQRHCTDKRVAFFSLETSIPAEDVLLRILRRGGMLA